MGTKAERSGWFQRRSERRALADHPAHEDVEVQLRALSTQWRRGIASHTTGLRPRGILAHDNVRFRDDAKVTLVYYGDYESTECRAAAKFGGRFERQFGDDLRMA